MEASQTTDLARERSVGEILSASLSMYRRYPLLFVSLAIGVIAPYELVRLAVTGLAPLGSTKGVNEGTLLLFELVYYTFVGPLISALHVHAVMEIGEGRKPRLASVAVQGLRVLPVVAAAEIVATILIALGFLALIVPGVLLALGWSVVAQTAAVEHDGWLPALRRSRRLTAGHYWHVLRLLVAVGVLTFVVSVLAGAATSANSADALAVVIGIAVYTIIASFAALTLAILYFDLRARAAAPRTEQPQAPII